MKPIVAHNPDALETIHGEKKDREARQRMARDINVMSENQAAMMNSLAVVDALFPKKAHQWCWTQEVVTEPCLCCECCGHCNTFPQPDDWLRDHDGSYIKCDQCNVRLDWRDAQDHRCEGCGEHVMACNWREHVDCLEEE